MRKLIALAAVASALAVPALANETEKQCLAYTAENEGDPSGCACLGAAAEKDPALAAALAAIDSPEALEAADDATKSAIAACWPNS